MIGLELGEINIRHLHHELTEIRSVQNETLGIVKQCQKAISNLADRTIVLERNDNAINIPPSNRPPLALVMLVFLVFAAAILVGGVAWSYTRS